MTEVRHDNDLKGSQIKRQNSDDSISDEGSDAKRGRTADNELTTSLSRDSSTSSTTSTRSTSSTRQKRYICAECNKAYNRPSLLQQHLMSHTGDKPYKCEDCNEAFSRKDHLFRHKLKHLPIEERPYHCAICSKGCSTVQHLRRHEKVHEKSFKCDKCDETFFKHQTLKHHINSVHLKNRLTCSYCNKEFKRPYRLENHKLKLHNESPGYQCTFPGCFKNFKTWSVLSLHSKTDHPKLVCKICGKGCIGKSGLEMHLKVHDEETAVKLWKCLTCLSSFLKKEDLQKHSKELHEYLPQGTDETSSFTTMDQPLACSPLAITTPPSSTDEEDSKQKRTTTTIKRNYGALPANISLDFMTKLISERVDERIIPCKYSSCNRLFKKQYDLDRHLNWHSTLDARLTEKIKVLKGSN